MQPGFFISIEGTEGAGKSTIKEFIATSLQAKNIPFLLTREPGGTPIAEELRKILLNGQGEERITPISELLLMFAARSQHLHHLLLPTLAAGKWVITDRFIDASYAYQGGGRQLDQLTLELLDKWVVSTHYPHLTYLLDLPPDLGMIRIKSRGNGQPDRIEREKIDFFTRVRQVYLQRALADPERIKVIDASQPLNVVQQQVGDVLDTFINQRVQMR